MGSEDPNRFAPLPCNVLVLRALLYPNWIDTDSGRILPDAFMPRTNGKDDRGLSVQKADSRQDPQVRDQARLFHGNFNTTFGIVTIHCGWVKDVHERLDVIPDNLPHALIIGVPVPRTADATALAEFLAGRLARISRLVWTPDDS